MNTPVAETPPSEPSGKRIQIHIDGRQTLTIALVEGNLTFDLRESGKNYGQSITVPVSSLASPHV